MQIPYLFKPLGFPKQLPCTFGNVRKWANERNPGALQSSSPVGLASDAVGLFGFFAWLGGLIFKEDMMRKWGGWATIISFFPGFGISLSNGSLLGLIDGLRGSINNNDYERHASRP